MRTSLTSLRGLLGICAVLICVGCHKGTEAAQSVHPGSSAGQEQAVQEPGVQEQAQEPVQGPACGKIACAQGEICCNASCSICTPPDGMCTQQICEQETPSAAPGPPATGSAPPGGGSAVGGAVNGAPSDGKLSCANVRCMAGTHCEMVQVQCVRAPCDPVPECKPDAAAPSGAGIPCGKSTCAAGQTCCNASCGICTDPGKGCIKMLCPDGQMPR